MEPMIFNPPPPRPFLYLCPLFATTTNLKFQLSRYRSQLTSVKDSLSQNIMSWYCLLCSMKLDFQSASSADGVSLRTRISSERQPATNSSWNKSLTIFHQFPKFVNFPLQWGLRRHWRQVWQTCSPLSERRPLARSRSEKSDLLLVLTIMNSLRGEILGRSYFGRF